MDAVCLLASGGCIRVAISSLDAGSGKKSSLIYLVAGLLWIHRTDQGWLLRALLLIPYSWLFWVASSFTVDTHQESDYRS